MNIAEELQLAEQQIHILNQAQKLYPPKMEKIEIRLSNTKFHYWYNTYDEILDKTLDDIIISLTSMDDYIIQVWIEDELLFESNITKECFDKIKKILDADKN